MADKEKASTGLLEGLSEATKTLFRPESARKIAALWVDSGEKVRFLRDLVIDGVRMIEVSQAVCIGGVESFDPAFTNKGERQKLDHIERRQARRLGCDLQRPEVRQHSRACRRRSPPYQGAP